MRKIALSCRAFRLLPLYRKNAADEVPPFQKRVLTRKAPGGDAYTWYTRGAHRA